MTEGSFPELRPVAEQLRVRVPRLDPTRLLQQVAGFVERRAQFLAVADGHGSPLYVIDREALKERADRFRRAFADIRPNLEVYFAVKSNNHPAVAACLINSGCGLDVSSGRELQFALNLGADRIVFSGPGKQRDELLLALANHERVTVLIDSFGELERLGRLSDEMKVRIRCGVRLTTDGHGIWRKFGILPERLSEFFDIADSFSNLALCGLQFHLSWNMNAEPHRRFIGQLGRVLRGLAHDRRQAIDFIDIGGGFWPEEGEWLQAAATPHGQLMSAVGLTEAQVEEHYAVPAISIEEFAVEIGDSLRAELPLDMNWTLCLEPGRWLCHGGMHLLLSVVDRKSDDLVITDGGINAIGWERFESDFFPVINLSRPASIEQPCLVAGSLCTPHDLWGYSYFGAGIDVGDVLLIPNQGAYTYSLRQEFIKPLPMSAELKLSQETADVIRAVTSNVDDAGFTKSV